MDPITLGLLGLGGSTLGSYFTGLANADKAKAGTQAYNDRLRDADAEAWASYNQQRGELGNVANMFAPTAQLGSSALNQIMQASGNLPQAQQFQYNKTLADFLDPAREKATQDALQSQQYSYLAQGKGLSGSAQKALQDKAMADSIATRGVALQEFQADRGNAYQQAMDYFNNQRASALDRINALGTVAGYGQQALGNQANVMQSSSALRGQLADQRNQITMDRANMEAQNAMAGAGGWQSMFGNLLSGGAQLAGMASTQPQGYRPSAGDTYLGNNTWQLNRGGRY